MELTQRKIVTLHCFKVQFINCYTSFMYEKIPWKMNTFSEKKEGKMIYIFQLIIIQAQLLLKACTYFCEEYLALSATWKQCNTVMYQIQLINYNF